MNLRIQKFLILFSELESKIEMETILAFVLGFWGVFSVLWITKLINQLEHEKWQHKHFERESEIYYNAYQGLNEKYSELLRTWEPK